MHPGKKLLSLLLTLALCAGLTVPALAGGIAPTLHDGSGQVTLDQSGSGTGWTYDADTNTLTLNGFNGAYISYADEFSDLPLTVVLQGQNTITGSVASPTGEGALVSWGGLVLQGDGSLTVSGGLNAVELTVSGGTVSVTGDAANGNAVAARNITVSGGSLTAVPAAGVLSAGRFYSGIQCTDSLTMTGGAIRVDQPTAADADNNDAIHCNGALTLTGGSLTAAGSVFAASLTLGDGMSAVGGFHAGDDLPLTFEDGRFKAATNEGSVLSHYVSVTGSGTATETPAQPEETPAPAANTAYATSYSILVDGQAVAFDAYALKDASGNDTNYLKLRDVAYVLNGTAAQFNVGWDQAAQAIAITTGAAYTTPNGSEMSTPFTGDQTYVPNAAAVVVDGADAGLEAISIYDAAGNGYTYFKLRDLGDALGFGVDWDQTAGAIVIDTKG